MSFRIFAMGIAAGLFFTFPAIAAERSGAAHFDTRFGPVVTSFQQSCEPLEASFARTGEVRLNGGRTLSYALSATCPQPRSGCAFTGVATGPFGGTWRATGILSRAASGLHVVGELTAPDGRTVAFDRYPSGRAWQHWARPETTFAK